MNGGIMDHFTLGVIILTVTAAVGVGLILWDIHKYPDTYHD